MRNLATEGLSLFRLSMNLEICPSSL